MDDQTQKISKNTKTILGDTTFSKVFRKSVRELKPSKVRFVILCLLVVLFYYINYYLLLTNTDIIQLTVEAFSLIQTIILPIFAVVITGYAIFQALANGSTLLILLSNNEGEISKFQQYNYFFFGVSILLLSIISILFIIKYIVLIMPDNWSIPFIDDDINNHLYALSMSIFLVITINALIEVKSFIYNLFQCFNTNAASEAIEFIKKNSDGKN